MWGRNRRRGGWWRIGSQRVCREGHFPALGHPRRALRQRSLGRPRRCWRHVRLGIGRRGREHVLRDFLCESDRDGVAEHTPHFGQPRTAGGWWWRGNVSSSRHGGHCGNSRGDKYGWAYAMGLLFYLRSRRSRCRGWITGGCGGHVGDHRHGHADQWLGRRSREDIGRLCRGRDQRHLQLSPHRASRSCRRRRRLRWLLVQASSVLLRRVRRRIIELGHWWPRRIG